MKDKLLQGFTLIELLIVVAIIAILAAIAVPNFLEAQTRAKVSRCKADQRTLAIAFEAYFVDNNTYSRYNNVFLKMSTNHTIDYTTGHADGYASLTTPIAYITNAMPEDPFLHFGGQSTNTFREPIKTTYEWAFADDAGNQSTRKMTMYCLQGYGPDTDDDLIGMGSWAKVDSRGYYNGSRVITVYDPSNGTVSDGDIYRIKAPGPIMAALGNNK